VRIPAARISGLEYIGFIGTASGERHVYVKDTRTGDLFRLNEGKGSYRYEESGGKLTADINGILYEVNNNGF
jgi:hypothetical protein